MVAMGLCLQEADPRVELGHDAEVLVVGRHDAHEGGFVRSDLRNVAVAAGAELRMAVAAVLRLGWRPMEGLVDLCGDGND